MRTYLSISAFAWGQQGLSLGELIRPFCIMLLYRYLLHFELLFHIMSQYLWLFSLILQGLHKEGECQHLNSGFEKEQILETYSTQLQKFWNSTEYLIINNEKSSPKMKTRGPRPFSRGWGAPAPPLGRPLPRGPPGGSPMTIFSYMKSFVEKKIRSNLSGRNSAATRRNLGGSNTELR